MKEALLHYLWRFQCFNTHRLCTTAGEPIKVIHPGTLNLDAGPDFFNAKIRIGKTTWAGNVEIHRNSADWRKHNHHQNPVYNNVILHVVYEAGAAAISNKGRSIPTLALNRFIQPALLAQYETLMNSSHWVPCNTNGEQIDPLNLLNWQSRLLWERLERKGNEFLTLLRHNKGEWERAFCLFLATHFGFGKNNVPFQMLARSIPRDLLAGLGNKITLIEAVVFGQSGLLPKLLSTEPYARQLHAIYTVYKKEYQLASLQAELWTYFRLRPSGFPHIRLAQYASWIANGGLSWERLLETKHVEALEAYFNRIPSPFLSKTKSSGPKNRFSILGKGSVLYILVNAIVPALFAYGQKTQDERIQQRALDWLSVLPAEENRIVRNWRKHRFVIRSAYISQAMIELKNNYCSHKKCLNCTIGNVVLQTNRYD